MIPTTRNEFTENDNEGKKKIKHVNLFLKK